MKRLRLAILLSILLVLIPLCAVAFAALLKTTSIIVLDDWQRVSAGTLVVGNAGNISDAYDCLLYLEIPYIETEDQDGVKVSIEVSYGDDDWTLLTKPFTTPSFSPAFSTLDGAVDEGDSDLTVLAVGDFNVGDKVFILDVVEAFSESVRIKSITGGDDLNLAHDLLRGHLSGSTVHNFVFEQIIPIPAAFTFVRVIINNVDANSDIFFTTRLSKVTSL